MASTVRVGDRCGKLVVKAVSQGKVRQRAHCLCDCGKAVERDSRSIILRRGNPGLQAGEEAPPRIALPRSV